MVNDVVAHTIREFNRAIHQSMTTVQSGMKQQTFETELNTIVDNIIQDVYGASEDAHNVMNKH
jgi:hypothetical protein